jgi:hypothetical protein
MHVIYTTSYMINPQKRKPSYMISDMLWGHENITEIKDTHNTYIVRTRRLHVSDAKVLKRARVVGCGLPWGQGKKEGKEKQWGRGGHCELLLPSRHVMCLNSLRWIEVAQAMVLWYAWTCMWANRISHVREELINRLNSPCWLLELINCWSNFLRSVYKMYIHICSTK